MNDDWRSVPSDCDVPTLRSQSHNEMNSRIELPLSDDRDADSPATVAELAPVSVRPAQPDDLVGVEDLIDPFVEARRLLPRTWDELSELLASGFVAVDEGRIVGFAALEVYSRKMSEIRSLCVATDYQGRGIGKSLVDACVGLAREKQVFEVMVITSSDNFFRSCGFDFTLPGEKKALFLTTREEP